MREIILVECRRVKCFEKKTTLSLEYNLTLKRSIIDVLLSCRECSGSPKRRIHRNSQQESKSECVKR